MNEINRFFIQDFFRRIDVMEEVIADAAGGNLWTRIPLSSFYNDKLSVIEISLNKILANLENETNQKLVLAEKLAKLKKHQ